MTEVIYIAHAKSTGGRKGQVETDDGALKLKLAAPVAAPTAEKGATNPEQLFACAYAACFGSALEFVARQKQISIANAEVQVDVSLNKGEEGFSIGATLNITLPGLEGAQAEELVNAAHQVCPYSKAIKDNVVVSSKINSQPLTQAA